MDTETENGRKEGFDMDDMEGGFVPGDGDQEFEMPEEMLELANKKLTKQVRDIGELCRLAKQSRKMMRDAPLYSPQPKPSKKMIQEANDSRRRESSVEKCDSETKDAANHPDANTQGSANGTRDGGTRDGAKQHSAIPVPPHAHGVSHHDVPGGMTLLRLLLRSAASGIGSAQYRLSFIYGEGYGVPVDHAEAIRWLRMAAEQGYIRAQHNLGWHYGAGDWIDKDEAMAAHWYRLAAESGFDMAQCNLGWSYEHALGVEQDFAEAVRWYRLSADQGNADGLCNLGWCYANGCGVMHDFTEARRYLTRSAEKKCQEAKEKLEIIDRAEREGRTPPFTWPEKPASEENPSAD